MKAWQPPPSPSEWQPTSQSVVVRFTFDPGDGNFAAPTTPDGHDGVVRAMRNMTEHIDLELEQCLVTEVEVLCSHDADGQPLTTKFLSLSLEHSTNQSKKLINPVVVGSGGKYPLALVPVAPLMYKRLPDSNECSRQDFTSVLNSESFMATLSERVDGSGTDAAAQPVEVPTALLHCVRKCFPKQPFEHQHRAKQGHAFVLSRVEFNYCRPAFCELLARVSDSFDNATIINAELSGDQSVTREISTVYVKFTFSCK